jgi:hypothetical protein
MIDIDEGNLKSGVLGLVLAVVEILRDALQNQATRRIESGTLTDEEVERLGAALADLDLAIEDIKREQGLEQVVQSVRDGLDDLVDQVVQQVTGSGELGPDPVGAESPELAGGQM